MKILLILCLSSINLLNAKSFTEPDSVIFTSSNLPLIVINTHGHSIHNSCLLYTSDAADERSSVDLGGRRIIKKKKNRS